MAAATPAPEPVPAVDLAAQAVERAVPIVETYTPVVVGYAARAVAVIVLLVLAHLLSGWLSRRITAALMRARLDVTLAKFFGALSRWAVLALAVISSLGIFGVQTASFAVVLGAVGLAIGLGFQGALANFAAGVLLLIFRPFKVGDNVVVSGVAGIVDEIGLISTAIDTPDNRRVILPNGPLLNATIENVNHHPRRRAEVTVGVPYSADVDAVRALLLRAAESVPERIPDRPAEAVLAEFGPSAVQWKVLVWAPTAQFGAARQSLVRAVKAALDDARIPIPYNQMDVHVRTTAPAAAQT